MLIFEKFKAPVVTEKPKYGKVIALTAIGVAAVEAAAFLGLVIAKKIHDSKIEKNVYDEGFELTMQAGELPVDFEVTEEAEDQAAEEANEEA